LAISRSGGDRAFVHYHLTEGKVLLIAAGMMELDGAVVVEAARRTAMLKAFAHLSRCWKAKARASANFHAAQHEVLL
jgi:hypothetical protein